LYCYALAQDKDFDDNELMINKIKDFIKSKFAARSHSSEQDEYEDADNQSENDTNPHFQLPQEDQSLSEADKSYISSSRFEEFKANVSLKLSQLSDYFLVLKTKIKKHIPSQSALREHLDSKKNSKQTKELILRFDRFLLPSSR